MGRYRTHTCGELRAADIDSNVVLSGWIHRKRDLGSLTFFDLRDRYGITQVVCEDLAEDLTATIRDLRRESSVRIEGRVRARAVAAKDPSNPTHEVELVLTGIEVFTACEVVPFEVNTDTDKIPENERLRYRFFDLRRERLQRNLLFRGRLTTYIRNKLDAEGFIEVTTPILSNSSPEGARDYLVPSRVHPGKFFALPQAPQQFKQLLMCGGIDRYYQIAPCFRDEDARADRSPGEFYQLDLEMAFVEPDDVFAVIERLMHGIVTDLTELKLQAFPFPRIPYREAIEAYGNDKPDLRYDMRFRDLAEVFADSEWGLLQGTIAKGERIKGICAPGAASRSRKQLDKLVKLARDEGAGGLIYIKLAEDGGWSSSANKFLTDADIEALRQAFGANNGDLILISTGPTDLVHRVLMAVRNVLAEELELADPDLLAFCWIVDYPMFEEDEETGKIDFGHNPFSWPKGGIDALNTQEPLDILADQYDIVCNGIELSSGAVRNYDAATMYKAFEIAGYGRDEVDAQFGHMIRAFQLGAPPHAGLAPGVDRLVMLLCQEPNIREVIAFPKSQKCEDLMLGAPSVVYPEQLEELHIRIVMPEGDDASEAGSSE